MNWKLFAARYKRKSSIIILSIFAIAVCYFSNLVISEIAMITPLSLDMTDNKLFSISDTSKNYLKQIPSTIKIIVVNEPLAFDSYIKKVLERIDLISENVTVEYIDPDLHPDYVKAYEKESAIAKNSMIIASNTRFITISSMDCYAMDENKNIIGFNAEGKIVSTIINLIENKQKTVKFTAGHDEGGYTELTKLFINNNCKVEKVNLNNEELSIDTDLLVISNPRRDFDSSEIDKLDRYTRNGGKVMIFKDPRISATIRIDQFLSIWGIKNENSIIIDKTYYYLNNPLYIISKVSENDDYKKISTMDKIIISPFTQSLQILFDKGISGSYKTEALLTSSDKSFAKAKISQSSMSYVQGDAVGPLYVALITKNSSYLDSRSVPGAVFFCGSGVFADDTLLTVQNFANSDFLLAVSFNMMGTLGEFSIPVKYFDSGYLNISSNTSKILGNIFTIVFPMMIFCAGLIVWVIRRNK